MKSLFTALFLVIAAANAFAIEYEIVETKSSFFYKSYVVKYVSVSADMTATETVSGVITIPSSGSANCIILDNHHTISSNAEAPSVKGSTAAGMLFSLAYVVAATDYIGYGATREKVHPYLCQRQNALNAIDIAKVAWDIVEKQRVKLKYGSLVNVGYSQGGGVAMAVHREMERNPELAEELRFCGSWCGDGPYDIKATVMEYLNHSESVSYPVGLPMLVNGFLSGAPAELKGNLKFADFIADDMLEAGLETWIADKNMDNDDINDKMRAVVSGRELTLGDVFKPEMARFDGALAKKYLEFAEADCICTGWQPSYPIKLIHLMCDEVVPVSNAYSAIDGLKLSSDQYFLDDKVSTHADYGTSFYLKLITEFDSFDFNTPVTSVSTPAAVNAKRHAKRLEGGRIIIERNAKKYELSGKAIQSR